MGKKGRGKKVPGKVPSKLAEGMVHGCRKCADEGYLFLYRIPPLMVDRWCKNMLFLKCMSCHTNLPQYGNDDSTLWIPAYVPGMMEDLLHKLTLMKEGNPEQDQEFLSINEG